MKTGHFLPCTVIVVSLAMLGSVWAGGAVAAGEPAVTRTLGERIRQDEQLTQWCDELSDAGGDALQVLVDQSNRLGRMLTLGEFVVAMEAPFFPLKDGLELKAVGGLKLNDYDLLWSIFSRAQQPVLPRTKLVASLSSARESIRAIRVRYTVEETRQNLPASVQRCEFAVSDGQFYFDRTPDPEEDVDRKIDAYDGRVVRELFDRGGKLRGVVQALDSRARFVRDSNPLVQSGIMNSFELPVGELYDVARQAKDLVIFEEPEEFEGVRCIMMGWPGHRFYLAPQFNFAVAAVDSCFQFDKQAGRLNETEKYTIQRNSEFEDFGQGLWLPKKMETTYYEAGKIVMRRTTRVIEWNVNQKIDAALFADVIPSGVLVTDALRRETYRQEK